LVSRADDEFADEFRGVGVKRVVGEIPRQNERDDGSVERGFELYPLPEDFVESVVGQNRGEDSVGYRVRANREPVGEKFFRVVFDVFFVGAREQKRRLEPRVFERLCGFRVGCVRVVPARGEGGYCVVGQAIGGDSRVRRALGVGKLDFERLRIVRTKQLLRRQCDRRNKRG